MNTTEQILERFPKGTAPKREEIKLLYRFLSKSAAKIKKSRKLKDGTRRVYYASTNVLKGNRGRRLWLKMIKEGFWKEF